MDREGHLQPLEGLLAQKVLTDAAQHGHVLLHPLYFQLAGRGEINILYITHLNPPKIF